MRITLNSDILPEHAYFVIEKDLQLTTKELISLAKSNRISPNTMRKYAQMRFFPKKIIFQLCKLRKQSYTRIIGSQPRIKIRSKETTLPQQITKDLAYFVGYLQADGCIEKTGKRITFSDDEYLSQIKQIQRISYKLFKDKGNIREVRSIKSKKPAYNLEIGNKVICSFISRLFSINLGVKKDLQINNLDLKDQVFSVQS